MLKRVWENRVIILQALKNRLFSSKEIKAQAKVRLAICKDCPSNSRNTEERPSGDLPYTHCVECGCMLGLKVYSQDKCPLGKW